MKEYDDITLPEHYNVREGIEPKDFIMSNNLNLAEGNIIKYIYRAPFKGSTLKDYEKAKEYINILIETHRKKTIIEEYKKSLDT
jgi:hypothetical protein